MHIRPHARAYTTFLGIFLPTPTSTRQFVGGITGQREMSLYGFWDITYISRANKRFVLCGYKERGISDRS